MILNRVDLARDELEALINTSTAANPHHKKVALAGDVMSTQLPPAVRGGP